MYRQTSKAIKCQHMRDAKARKREAQGEREPIWEPPSLRKRLLVTDFDFGEEVHLLELWKTGRIDQYRVMVDDNLWLEQAGLSRILQGLRKAMPRVQSPYSV